MFHCVPRTAIRLIVAMMLLLSLTLPVASFRGGHAAAASATTITMNGQVANAGLSSWHNVSSASAPNIDMFVSQGGTASNRQTFLGYEVYYVQQDPNGY